MSELISRQLKPCPFCGGEAIIDMDGDWYWNWKVFCHGCGCDIGYYATEAEATEAWNRRTQSPVLPWIPVSSGILPTTGQQIFATCEQDGELDVMEIYYNSELLVPPWKMTAWMPAEPYNGEE